MPGGETACAKVLSEDRPCEVQAPGWRAVSDGRGQTEFRGQAGSCASGVKTPNARGQAGGRDESRWGTTQVSAHVPCAGTAAAQLQLRVRQLPGPPVFKEELKSILHREMAFYSKM